MPYTRSTARATAKARVKLLRSSFVYARIRTRILPTYIRDAIFQNCVFQLSAILEDYLNELASRWFANLTAAGAMNSAVPVLTRAFFAAKSQEELFKRFLASGDENDLAVRTVEKSQIFSLFNDGGPIPALDFSSKIVKDRKFPSVYNIESMFRRLGIPKILQLLSKRTRTNVEFSLRAFMDVRNALAHESPPSITDLDVDRYFQQVEVWVEAIDREFYGHVVRCSGARYWT